MKKLALALAICALSFTISHVQAKEIESVHRYHVGNKCFVIVTTYYSISRSSYTRDYSCEYWDKLQAQKHEQSMKLYHQLNSENEEQRKTRINAILSKIFELYPVQEPLKKIVDFYDQKNLVEPHTVAESLTEISLKTQTFLEFKKFFSNTYNSGFFTDQGHGSVFDIYDATLALKSSNNQAKFLGSWQFKEIESSCKNSTFAFYNNLIHDNGEKIHFGILLRINPSKQKDLPGRSFISMDEIEIGKSKVCD